MRLSVTHQLRSCRPYAANAARLILIDRGMFVADFLLATIVPFAMQYLIWSFLYSAGQIQSESAMTLTQTLFYYAFAIAFGRLNNGYDIVAGLSDVVREGALEPHLLRPLPYPVQKLADFMGGGVLYMVPIFAVTILFLAKTGVQPSFAFWSAWLLLLVLSQLLCFCLSWMVGLLSLSLTRTDFALALLTTSGAFFGGELLPPEFWPNWLQPVMAYNPFRFMVSAPAEAMVKSDIGFLVESVIWTAGYIAIFAAVSALLWKRGMATYRGAGG